MAIHELDSKLSSLPQGQLDLNVFYLDDGVLAGDAQVVSAALNLLKNEGLQLGLKLKVSKCELVLPGPSTDADLTSLFPQDLLISRETGESRILTHGNFELLGAAIGDATFCNDYTCEKVTTASKLLDQLAKCEDPQVCVRLLQKCAGVCKVTHSMRMTPPDLHATALKHFDSKVYSTFSQVTGLFPDNQQWNQACRGFSHAGLGLRQAHLHKEAAFLASTASASTLCHDVDPAFTLQGSDHNSEFGRALTSYNTHFSTSQQLTAAQATTHTQKQLSAKLDEAGHQSRLASVSNSDRATLISECQDGAKDFWNLVPSTALGLAVPAAEYVVELQYRLCMDQDAGEFCPLCDTVLDNRGHHCRQCSAGGDRTVRHNGVRNEVFKFCHNEAAIHNAELEKPGAVPCC